MKNKRLRINSISSLVCQMASMICGMVLPALIVRRYGSETNGLINSVMQFLQVIYLFEGGVTAVTQTNLYKPIIEGDNDGLSKVISSGTDYLRKLGIGLLIYIVCLMIIYPKIIDNYISWTFCASLIFVLGINLLIQYWIGNIDQIILIAHQRGYVYYCLQTISIILGTVFSWALIINGCSIIMVKLVPCGFFLIKAIVIRLYVNRKYSINRSIEYDEEPIKQKRNAIAQNISAFVLDGTDMVLITLFLTLKDVSVYSVYYMVVYGVRTIQIAITREMSAVLGGLVAADDLDRLKEKFLRFELFNEVLTLLLWGCTVRLIVPFINFYTKGVVDVDYNLPIFGILLSLAYMLAAFRIPYLMLIFAAGHYKETERIFITTPIVNIVISVLLLSYNGLVGLAIGTLVAMLYMTIWTGRYVAVNILNIKYSSLLYMYSFFGIAFIGSVYLTYKMKIYYDNMLHLGYSGCIVFLITGLCVGLVYMARFGINRFGNLDESN